MGASTGGFANEIRSALIRGIKRTFDPDISGENVRVFPLEYKDYVSIQIVSPQFKGRHPDERTQAVFAALEAERVSKQVQNKITMVLTLTPDEHSEYVNIESGPSTDEIRRVIQSFARQHKREVFVREKLVGQPCLVVAYKGRTAELLYWDLIGSRGKALRSYLAERLGPLLGLPKRAFDTFPAVVGDESLSPNG